jgi:hypothetical protein
MTIKDLMQQDPREFFGFDDPRAIQEVLADDDAQREPSAGELLAAIDPVTAHDMDALLDQGSASAHQRRPRTGRFLRAVGVIPREPRRRVATLKIMYQKNLYKYTVINYTQNPPSLGGNWEVGTETSVCFSRSPKKAMAFEGAVTERYEGVDGLPRVALTHSEQGRENSV